MHVDWIFVVDLGPAAVGNRENVMCTTTTTPRNHTSPLRVSRQAATPKEYFRFAASLDLSVEGVDENAPNTPYILAVNR